MRHVKFAATALAISVLWSAGLASAEARNARKSVCDATFRVYFQQEESRLNRPARAVIAAAADDLHACAAPVVAFAASRDANDALLPTRRAAILSALRSRGVAATPVDTARASLISSVNEGAPAYVQVSVAPTAREAVAAAERALPREHRRRDRAPIS